MELISKLRIFWIGFRTLVLYPSVRQYLLKSSLVSSRIGFWLIRIYALALAISMLLHWQEILSTDLILYSVCVGFIPVLLVNSIILSGVVSGGIIKADSGAKHGLDYAWSVKKCNKSFKFMGIGAAKLTSNEEDFRSMHIRCIKNGGEPPELLLCDPDSIAISQLEGLAQVSAHKFRTNIGRSYQFLKDLSIETGTQVSIKQYKPSSKDALPFFRLVFIDDEFCLVSPGDYGNSDLGTNVPQILIERGVNPTLYYSFLRYFERLQHPARVWNP